MSAFIRRKGRENFAVKVSGIKEKGSNTKTIIAVQHGETPLPDTYIPDREEKEVDALRLWNFTICSICTTTLVAGFLASGTLEASQADASITSSQIDFLQTAGEPFGVHTEGQEGLKTYSETQEQFDPKVLYESQRQLHRKLFSERVEEGLDEPLTIEVTEQDLLRMEQGDASRNGLIVGVTKKVVIPVRFANIPPLQSVYASQFIKLGAVRIDEDGLTWTGSVRSKGGYAIRVHLSDFNLPPGAEFYVYNSTGEVFGPYSGRGPGDNGDFWTNTVSGGELLLQLVYRGDDLEEVLEQTRFTVSDVGHLTEKFGAALSLEEKENASCTKSSTTLGGLCTWGIITNASCVENASCYEERMPSQLWNVARNGIAGMIIPKSSGQIEYCSGGLINDTDPNSQIPYFLTANHCITDGWEAAGMEAFFRYYKPCQVCVFGECTDWHGPCLSALATLAPRVLGSSIKKTSPEFDYTLLQLWFPPPTGSWLLGWTTAPVAYSAGYDLYRISHPSGAPQAYSEHQVRAWSDNCNASWPRDKFIYSKNTFGAVEPGSSGSPVLNYDGLVVGQAAGMCNSRDVCSEYVTVADGALAVYFEEIREFLHPAPVALCQSVTAVADAVTCSASVSVAQIDNGSYDPNGDPITLSVDPKSPYVLGITPVTLTVTDDGGLADTCGAKVTVVDTTPPVLSTVPDRVAECTSAEGTAVTVPQPEAVEHCSPPVTIASDEPALFPMGTIKVTFSASDNAGNQSRTETNVTIVDTTPPVIACNAPESITPPDAPITFTATASDSCGDTLIGITEYNCFKYTRKGKLIDKTDSCVVELEGDSVRILDSGGVGDNITWTISAVDTSGNASTQTCQLEVVKRGNQ